MKYVPPIGATDPNAPYITENLAAGIDGSPVAAEAIEHPMREIMAVITEAGLTPDEENLGQLLEAIEALIVAGGPGIASAAALGLIKVGSGLSINGSGVLSATLDGVTAPTANALVKALATGKIDSGWLDFTGSFGTTGWKKDPDGTIEQWGTVTTASGSGSVTFPIAFPTAVHTVLLTDNVAATPQATSIFGLGGAPTLTGFTVKAQTDAGASVADTANWRAWGK